MKRKISFFRFQSTIVLAAYLSCLVLPTAARCEQMMSWPEFRNSSSEDAENTSLILWYSVDRPARSMIFDVAPSPACSNHDVFDHKPGPSLMDGMDTGGARVMDSGRFRAPGDAAFIEYTIGQADESAGDAESKPWYKKWWIIGLGAAAVTGTVLLLVGGGDDSEPAADLPLPGFPDPPTPVFR